VTSAEAWDINGHPVLVRIENLGRVNQG
jgi:hypothetical protein